MSTITNTIQDLIGKPLLGFHVEEWFEVYTTDFNGSKSKTVKCFRDENIAKAYIQTNADPEYHGVSKALVLTDGTVGYLIQGGEEIKMFDEQGELPKMKAALLGKFSPEQQAILERIGI